MPSSPMSDLRFADHRSHLQRIRESILDAADPAQAVTRNITPREEEIQIGGHLVSLSPAARIFLVALGKASPAMCRAALGALPGERVEAGMAAVPRDYEQAAPPPITYIRAGHPLPDEGSLAAGQSVQDLLRELNPVDLVITLISGGGSAMLALPLPGITLDDLREINQVLIRSGAPIKEINIIRRAISQLKGGGLARMAAPARVVSLIMSDVVGDDLASIASGPTVLERPTPASAIATLKRVDIWDQTPNSVREALQRQVDQGDPASSPINILVATNKKVLEAARRTAEQIGFPSQVLRDDMTGEAREVGREFGEYVRSLSPPACRLMGGETTVTVRGEGRGGRNQELALSAATEIDGQEGTAIMSFATDGVDGPTDAAGAIVTGGTMGDARDMGINPDQALGENDSYPLLDALDCLLKTGPTGTNLNDICLGLVYPAE